MDLWPYPSSGDKTYVYCNAPALKPSTLKSFI